jgi:hypothetical protein
LTESNAVESENDDEKEQTMIEQESRLLDNISNETNESINLHSTPLNSQYLTSLMNSQSNIINSQYIRAESLVKLLYI